MFGLEPPAAQTRLAFSTHRPWQWLIGVGVLAFGAAFALYSGAYFFSPVPLALALALFHRQGIVADGQAGMITRWHQVLVLPWRVHLRVGDQGLFVCTETVTPRSSDGDIGTPWKRTTVWLGEDPLFVMREEQAIPRAQEMAKLLGVPLRVVAEPVNRRPQLHNALFFGGLLGTGMVCALVLQRLGG